MSTYKVTAYEGRRIHTQRIKARNAANAGEIMLRRLEDDGCDVDNISAVPCGELLNPGLDREACAEEAPCSEHDDPHMRSDDKYVIVTLAVRVRASDERPPHEIANVIVNQIDIADGLVEVSLASVDV